MILLIFIILLTLLAIYADKWIRKHNVLIYMGATLFSIVIFVFKDTLFMTPFMKGFLGLAFFYIVMIAGAIDKKYKIRAKLIGLRREYSIIGFIVIVPHALNNVLLGIKGDISLEWLGIISFALMIPLFFTSFLVIRKKMKPKNWKLLQSLAYIIYILLFIHLILNYSQRINLIIYILVFGIYFISKIIFEIKKVKERKQLKQ